MLETVEGVLLVLRSVMRDKGQAGILTKRSQGSLLTHRQLQTLRREKGSSLRLMPRLGRRCQREEGPAGRRQLRLPGLQHQGSVLPRDLGPDQGQ